MQQDISSVLARNQTGAKIPSIYRRFCCPVGANSKAKLILIFPPKNKSKKRCNFRRAMIHR